MQLPDSSPDAFEQLVKRVPHDKPGHEISIGFLRGGNTMPCKVVLGEAPAPMARFGGTRAQLPIANPHG